MSDALQLPKQPAGHEPIPEPGQSITMTSHELEAFAKKIIMNFQSDSGQADAKIAYERGAKFFKLGMIGAGATGGLMMTGSLSQLGTLAFIGLNTTPVGWVLVGVGGGMALLGLIVMLSKYNAAGIDPKTLRKDIFIGVAGGAIAFVGVHYGASVGVGALESIGLVGKGTGILVAKWGALSLTGSSALILAIKGGIGEREHRKAKGDLPMLVASDARMSAETEQERKARADELFENPFDLDSQEERIHGSQEERIHGSKEQRIREYEEIPDLPESEVAKNVKQPKARKRSDTETTEVRSKEDESP